MFRKIVLILFIIIFVSVAGLGIYVYWAINSRGAGPDKEFLVKSGQSTQEIAENLEQEGFITSATVFSWYAKARHGMGCFTFIA